MFLLRFQNANTEFTQAKSSNQSGAQREQLLKDLASGFDNYMELKSNLEEGTKVIKQLCTCLFFLCTQVSFWVNKVKVWNNFVPGFTPKSTKWKFWTTLSPALNELKKWKFRTALILTNLTFMDMQTTLNSILLNTALFYLIF